MKVLFLDDRQKRIDVAVERYKDDDLTVVRTAEEAIGVLSSTLNGSTLRDPDTWQGWDLVCLDHDLGGESFVDSNRKDCGMEVVRWMTAFRGPLNQIAKKVIIHSSNLGGAMTMYCALDARGYYTFYERFSYE